MDPTLGHEQRGRRPALVLSPRGYNERARLCVACAMTNHAKGYPFEVAIPDGSEVTGVVLADRIRSVSWEQRRAALIARAPPDVMEETREKVAALIG